MMTDPRPPSVPMRDASVRRPSCSLEPAELETTLLVLQPTPYCNIDCKYCYLTDRADRSVMSVDTARALVRSLEASGLNKGRVRMIWHAGEPLTLPPSYYREVLEAVCAEQPSDRPLSFGVQTNAIAVNEKFCELFREYGVKPGVSLDGPEALHDSRRLTRNGKGTHALTVRGLRLFQQWGLEPSVIAVVTRETLEDPRGFIDSFAELGITSLCLNFEEVEGAHRASSLHGAARSQVKDFLELLYEHSRQYPRMEIREIRTAYSRLSRARSSGHSQLTSPLSIVSVNWRGDFSTFSPELLGMKDARHGDFVFGNVHTGLLIDALKNEKFLRVHQEIQAGIEACRAECKYFAFCGGGTPSTKLAENGTFASAQTSDCAIRVKMLLELIAVRHAAALLDGSFWRTNAR